MVLYVYVGLLMAGTALSILMGWYAYRRRAETGAKVVVLLTVFMVVWCFTSVCEALAWSLEGKIIWSVLSYFGSQTIGVSFLMAALVFTGRDRWINPKRITLLFLMPAIQIFLAATNHFHHLIWSEILLETIPGGLAGVYERGSLFLMNIVYNYSLIILSYLLMIRHVLSTRGLFSSQSMIFLLSAFFPIIFSIAYVLNNRVIGGFDPTPLGFVITVCLLAWGILRFGFLKISPIAWAQVAMNLNDGLLVLNAEDTIIEWNPTFEQWVGRDALEVGKNAKDLLKKWPHILHLGKAQHPKSSEMEKHSPEYKVMHVTATPLKDRIGEPMGRALLFHDVTKLKLTQAMLEESRKEAHASNQAKSDFLANMSHEIRTPMNAVIGLNDLLSKTPLNKKQSDYVQKIGNASKNLLGILNDILDTSKIEAGKMTLEKIDFFLDDVVDHLASLMGGKAQEKGIELILSRSSQIPPALIGDPLRLGQVLINLCSNAIKFTEQGEVVVSIRLLEQKESKARLAFEIRDSGIGMTSEQIGRLFNAFTQADASTTRRFGGTGLGLTISKKIVEMMGGNLQVQSEVGKGSRFFFEAELAQGSEKRSVHREGAASLRGMKVLIVEDHAETRQVLHEYAVDLGFCPVLTSSGEEAVQAIDERIDLVFMDWKLPGIDGVMAWEQIKEKLSHAKLPKILFITAYDKEEVAQSLREEASAGILTKPVLPSSLFNAVMNLFGYESHKQPHTLSSALDARINLHPIRGARILLVEDNEINQQVARETLEAEGFWVDGAENGQVAWEKARNHFYDLILMDLQMPVLDGIEATLQIRSDPSIRKDLPIIALSADVMSQTREKVTEAGMNGSIPKPIDPLQLFETLKKWIPEGTREPFIPPQPSEEIDETQDAQDQIPQMRRMMPSIQVDVGLKRISNNHRLYKEILGKFLRNYEDFGKEWKENLDIANTEDVARKLHTLKGVAANIGAMKVQNLSEKLETLVIEGESILENPLFEALLEALEESQREIETYLIQQERIQKTTRAAQSYNREELVQRCKELEEALASYDTKAEEILAQIRPSLEAHLGDNETKAMEKVLSAYDFDQAQEICQKIIESLEGVS